MSEAFIGIGANLGNRVETLKRAVYNLSESVCLVGASRIYETEPIGFKDQPAYLNAVLKIETQMGARTLLNHLLALELQFGRIRKEKWGPRILDLDILLYGVEVIEEEVCTYHIPIFICVPLFLLPYVTSPPMITTLNWTSPIRNCSNLLGRHRPIRSLTVFF